MKHNHNHSCQCKHTSVKFCSHCNTVYCEGCNAEWKTQYTYSWYNPYPTSTYTIGNVWKAQQNSMLKDAIPLGSTTTIAETSCNHQHGS